MRIFVTGATGWVGSAVVEDLLSEGHKVTGLVRSPDKAASLVAAGADVVTGSLDDLDMLRATTGKADAVVHTAFNHDWAHFAESTEQDRRAIEGLGEALQGTDRPLIVTSGLSGVAPGRLATEEDRFGLEAPRKSEAAAAAVAERGGRVATIRFAPSVHGVGETHGFLPILIRTARETGVSAYIGEGDNRWAGAHRRDVAKLFRLVLEEGVTAPVYHAVADEGVPLKAIAEVIGRRLNLPVEPREAEHFGWFGRMAGADMAASSARTRQLAGWAPTGPDLLGDLDQPDYFLLSAF